MQKIVKYKRGTILRMCKYCKEDFSTRCTNAQHCSEQCYNYAKRCRKYNISYDEHRKLQAITNCQICKGKLAHYDHLEKKRLSEMKHCIDHCHKTNKVRGVVCDDCNRGLGAFRDDIETIKSSIKYLEEFDVN